MSRGRDRFGTIAFAVAFSLAALAMAAIPVDAEPPDNAACLECHAEPELTKELPDGTTISLAVAESVYVASVHGARGLACVDCHTGIAELPHEEDLPEVRCAGCHGDAEAAYARSIHARARAEGHKDAPTCAGCHGTHDILPPSDPRSPTNKLGQARMCATCHADPAVVARYAIPAHDPLAAYLKSVHGKALLSEENGRAPTCGSCHGAHDILPAVDPESRVNKLRVSSTCGECHGEVAAVYQESVHGRAVARGVADAPACIDCHGEHQIEAPSSPTSLVYPRALVETTCARCHESQILADRYGFSPDRTTTFRETYHGLATQLGGLPVANCASCHGVHNIFPSSDPRSTVNPANLQGTCGACHPSATEAFTQIAVHKPATVRPGHPIVKTIRALYIVLIVVVIGGMLLHNLLVWLAHVVRKHREEAKHPHVVRFSRFEVAEHALLAVSFFGLVFTGFALKYSDAFWVQWLTRLGFDEGLRSVVHRVLGVMLIALSVSQAVFFVATRRGRRDLAQLRPQVRDVTEVVGTLAYYLGRRQAPPRAARYSYAEKAEYLALIWGTVVMVLTGLVLWFPEAVTRWAPTWVVEASEVIHFFEAWLAFLAILVWHFFFVIFHPEEFPLSLTFLHGKVPKTWAERRDWDPAKDEGERG